MSVFQCNTIKLISERIGFVIA